jgi:hypothetical protein
MLRLLSACQPLLHFISFSFLTDTIQTSNNVPPAYCVDIKGIKKRSKNKQLEIGLA